MSGLSRGRRKEDSGPAKIPIRSDSFSRIPPGTEESIFILMPMENANARGQILIVDDGPMICQSCKEILEYEGYLVDMASSGEEGLKKVSEKKFDLILLDIAMPDISGLTLLKRMKAEQKSTPVVMVTAYSTVEAAVEAMKLGARDFVQKPFTPEELSRVVRSVIVEKGVMAERISPEQIISKDMVQKLNYGMMGRSRNKKRS